MRHSHIEAKTRYQLLLEHLPIIVYVNPIESIADTTYVSPQIETILGYTSTEWVADPEFWQTRLHPEDREAVMRT
jgi:PAS domain-containing protein